LLIIALLLAPALSLIEATEWSKERSATTN
jgi:hypothetical protein